MSETFGHDLWVPTPPGSCNVSEMGQKQTLGVLQQRDRSISQAETRTGAAGLHEAKWPGTQTAGSSDTGHTQQSTPKEQTQAKAPSLSHSEKVRWRCDFSKQRALLQCGGNGQRPTTKGTLQTSLNYTWREQNFILIKQRTGRSRGRMRW